MLCSAGVDSGTVVTAFGLALVCLAVVCHCLVVLTADVFGMPVSSTTSVCVKLVLGAFVVSVVMEIVLGVTSISVVETSVVEFTCLGDGEVVSSLHVDSHSH